MDKIILVGVYAEVLPSLSDVDGTGQWGKKQMKMGLVELRQAANSFVPWEVVLLQKWRQTQSLGSVWRPVSDCCVHVHLQ